MAQATINNDFGFGGSTFSHRTVRRSLITFLTDGINLENKLSRRSPSNIDNRY